jgi:hypothetical protein
MRSIKRQDNVVVDEYAGILERRDNLNAREPKNHQKHSITHTQIYTHTHTDIHTHTHTQICIFSPPPMAQQPYSGLSCFTAHITRSHSDTPQSVGLLRTSDRPDAESSTWQHTTFTRDIQDRSEIRTCNPSKRTAANPRIRRRGHWDWLFGSSGD